MNRRTFLGSILALGIAPAIVRAQNIMPVRSIIRLPAVRAAGLYLTLETSAGPMTQFVPDVTLPALQIGDLLRGGTIALCERITFDIPVATLVTGTRLEVIDGVGALLLDTKEPRSDVFPAGGTFAADPKLEFGY